jgi:hypothetical protein
MKGKTLEQQCYENVASWTRARLTRALLNKESPSVQTDPRGNPVADPRGGGKLSKV